MQVLLASICIVCLTHDVTAISYSRDCSICFAKNDVICWKMCRFWNKGIMPYYQGKRSSASTDAEDVNKRGLSNTCLKCLTLTNGQLSDCSDYCMDTTSTNHFNYVSAPFYRKRSYKNDCRQCLGSNSQLCWKYCLQGANKVLPYYGGKRSQNEALGYYDFETASDDIDHADDTPAKRADKRGYYSNYCNCCSPGVNSFRRKRCCDVCRMTFFFPGK